MGNPRIYDSDKLTLVFNDDDPEKTKESMTKLIELFKTVLRNSPDMIYITQTNKVLEAYNKTISLCFETRRLQIAANNALKQNKADEYIQNFNDARTKFKELQTQVKSQKIAQLNTIPPLTDEIKARLGSLADKISQSHADLLESKKYGDKLYKTTETSNKEMVATGQGLTNLSADVKAGKELKSASEYFSKESDVKPKSSAQVAPLQSRQPQGVPSVHDAKKQDSKLKAEELNRLSGGGGGVANKNPNSKKTG